MKKLVITMGLTLLASSNVAAAIETLSEQDLMNHYVAELEAKIIGQAIDLYDGDAVSEAVRKHQLYLMLCSNKIATGKCDQAKEDLSKLNNESPLTSISALKVTELFAEFW